LHFGGFGIKKNLTEINHKVSVIAKWFRRVFAGVFAVKCAKGSFESQNSGICREAVMQDASVGSWAQESHWSAEVLGSLRDLNHRFLDLAAARTDDWVASGATGATLRLAGQVAALTAAQRAAAAGCPYALFDLRFQDHGHWRSRLQNLGAWRVADETVADDDTVSFVRLALFYAWHVASSTGLKAQLLLGMNGNTAAAFRRITVNQLPALVVTESANLSARWSDCSAFWSALTGAASRADPKALRRVQLYGLQLAAAARLSGP
jgi:hypothetical protein